MVLTGVCPVKGVARGTPMALPRGANEDRCAILIGSSVLSAHATPSVDTIITTTRTTKGINLTHSPPPRAMSMG